MFRPAVDTDFDALHHIYSDATVSPYMSWEPVSKAGFAECFALLSERDEFLVFEKEAVVVGVVTVTRGKWRKAHVASLGSLAIRADQQGKGIATQMIQQLTARLRDEGVRRVELIVESDNPGAIRLYEKMGFEREGVFREYFHRVDDDQPVDDYMMSKLL